MKLPIRTRLALVYSSVFFVLIAVLEAGTYFGVKAAVHSLADRELEARLAGIVDHLDRHIDRVPWPKLHKELTERPAFQPGFFLMRRVDANSSATMFQGHSMLSLPVAGYLESPRTATFDEAGQVLRVLNVRKAIKGKLYDLAVATDLLIPSAVLRQLWLAMLLSLPVVLLIAAAVGYWIAGSSLAPVSALIAAARAIDSTRLRERIGVPNTGDEIQLLAETINNMLTRIEDGFRQIQQFTANASHELRTPAAIIRASAEVALLQSPGEERRYREALHRILRQAEQNSALLENMLQLARSDSGADHADAQPVDLAQSLAQACAQVSPLAESKELQLHLTTQPVSIYASDDHLRRLWLILLENAVKYTPAGGSISVSIGLTAQGQPRCSISDTGIGIPAEHLPRIFERFYRVDKARNRAEGGTGLGLSIAAELASLYGAVIDVDSQPSHGATFFVTFPLHLHVHRPVLAASATLTPHR